VSSLDLLGRRANRAADSGAGAAGGDAGGLGKPDLSSASSVTQPMPEALPFCRGSYRAAGHAITMPSIAKLELWAPEAPQMRDATTHDERA